MTDIIIKHFHELEEHPDAAAIGQQFFDAGKSMGISDWDMDIIRMPPHWLGYPVHDHRLDGRQKVYVVLDGHGVIQSEGYNWQVGPGMLIRVGPSQKRKFIPGMTGLTLLTLGTLPNGAYPGAIDHAASGDAL